MLETTTKLGARMKARRLRLKLTQGQAATAAGVHLITWHRWEAGKTAPGTDRLDAIASALKTRIRNLL